MEQARQQGETFGQPIRAKLAEYENQAEIVIKHLNQRMQQAIDSYRTRANDIVASFDLKTDQIESRADRLSRMLISSNKKIEGPVSVDLKPEAPAPQAAGDEPQIIIPPATETTRPVYPK